MHCRGEALWSLDRRAALFGEIPPPLLDLFRGLKDVAQFDERVLLPSLIQAFLDCSRLGAGSCGGAPGCRRGLVMVCNGWARRLEPGHDHGVAYTDRGGLGLLEGGKG